MGRRSLDSAGGCPYPRTLLYCVYGARRWLFIPSYSDSTVCSVLGRWLFNADDPEMDEGFGVKFARHKVCVHMYVQNILLDGAVLLDRKV